MKGSNILVKDKQIFLPVQYISKKKDVSVAMFDLRKAPITKMLLPFIGGALSGYIFVFPLLLSDIGLICLITWCQLVILYLRHKLMGIWIHLLFNTLVCFLFLTLGFWTGKITRPVDPGLPVGEGMMVRGRVLEEPYSGRRNWIMDMKVFMISGWDSTYGTQSIFKVYFEMPDDSILPIAGEIWQLYGQLSSIKNSGNPGEPDYAAILHRKNCWYRFFADPRYPATIKGDDSQARKVCSTSIRKVISQAWSGDPEVTSLLKAVCLGDRSGLTENLRYNYSTAGGMHLLAVSGLHVGLIWWVLQHLLAWMVRLFHTEIYRALFIIALLWFYAYVTGFSSSVSRSVTMFTFFSTSRMIDQRTHPVNGILVSAFLLILINPGKLLDVGFQLSYAAILGIVTIYPKLRNMVKLKNRVLKWIWDATMVSLAAQLSTAPLVAYYFHQLPTYSLLTNLFAIPLLSCLMAIFVISIPFTIAGTLGVVFNALLFQMGTLMNRSMEFMASLPGALISELYLDQLGLIIWMVLVFLISRLLSSRSTFPRFALLFVISVLLVWTSWTRYKRLQSGEMAVWHFHGASLLTIREGRQVDHYFWVRDTGSSIYMDKFKAVTWDKRRYKLGSFNMNHITQAKGGISVCEKVVPGLWTIGNSQICGWVISGSIDLEFLKLIIDQPRDFILLSCDPQIRNTSLFEGLRSCELIVDGSNRNLFIHQMEEIKGPIHFTGQEGAYLKRW